MRVITSSVKPQTPEASLILTLLNSQISRREGKNIDEGAKIPVRPACREKALKRRKSRRDDKNDRSFPPKGRNLMVPQKPLS